MIFAENIFAEMLFAEKTRYCCDENQQEKNGHHIIS
jgi:hypothetical protein